MKKIKLGFLFLFLVFGITSLFTGDQFVTIVESFPGGPPPGVTGAPGEETCIQCHSDNVGAGLFTITAPESYQPGAIYQIVVRHTTPDTTRKRWGFELTALAGTTAAGTFANLSNSTQTFNGFNRQYVSHTLLGTFQNQMGGAQWIFSWTAPTTNAGTVSFYAAGNQANGDNTTNGDQIYTAITQVPFGGTPTPTPTPTLTPTPTPTPTPIPTPTATPTPTQVSGRVLTPDGRGIRNASVILTDSQGVRRIATTSSFGFYSFDNVLIGQSYVVSVSTKRYRFAARQLDINGSVTDLDFFGLE